MNPDRLKQLRQSWTHRRGMRTVHALIDAIEAAEAMDVNLDCTCYSVIGEGRKTCGGCESKAMFRAAKARI